MDFSRLEWGRVAKNTAVEKQGKYAVTADNKALRSFCKGWGESAKQRWGINASGVRMQRWGWNAKGCGRIAKASRERGRNAKGRAETRPDAINFIYPLYKR